MVRMSGISPDELRRKHPKFRYVRNSFSHQGETLEVTFEYLLEPDLVFKTTLTFEHLSADRFHSLNPKIIQNWLNHLGIVEGFSYWKAACSPEFVIEVCALNDEQLRFWQELLHKGMSEFFFINKINGWAEDFVKFSATGTEDSAAIDQEVHSPRVIIPMGGGKDSVVSWEVMKELLMQKATLTINPTGQVKGLLTAAQPELNIVVNRQLDPQILQLNEQGYLNGHTPFSAMASFVTTLAAYLYDYTWVAVSNEWSANEGNTTFLGQQINHQYSKTIEYEKNFREYCQKYLSTTVQYFSFMRPLHEIQIAKLFAQSPQYFSLFLSCNRGQKTGNWCGECPKCLFVYTMLAPFLEHDQLASIFGSDLFEKAALQPILDELTGMVEVKSLECVGTREEMLIALGLTLQKLAGKKLPVLLQHAQDVILKGQEESTQHVHNFLHQFQSEHFIPQEFVDVLKHKIV